MTDYILTTKTVDEWMATVKRGHSLVTGVTNALEIASGVGDVTILIPVPPNGAQVPVTIPFSMIGNAAQTINLVAAQNPPKSIRYIETAVGDKLKIDNIMLPDRIIGYEAKFDEHGNLTIIYSREYRFTQRQW